MSKDSRRIVGPEGGVPYSAYVERREEVAARQGRGEGEHRKVFLKTGVVSQAKGSCYLEQGGSKLMAAVYGPREVGEGDHLVDPDFPPRSPTGVTSP